jgi:hypothetical protein
VAHHIGIRVSAGLQIRGRLISRENGWIGVGLAIRQLTAREQAPPTGADQAPVSRKSEGSGKGRPAIPVVPCRIPGSV